MTEKEFQNKMLEVSREAIKNIDPDLTVSVELVKKPQYPKGREELVFRHKKNPKITWAMLPYYEGDDAYFARLPDNIKGIYEEAKKK